MKLIALLGAGALAAGTMAAVPAQAQRYGYDRYDSRDYRGGGDYRDRGRWRDGRGWQHGYRDGRYGRGYFDRGYYHRGYRDGRGYYGRSRIVCRVRHGYYGPVRRCFRI